MYWIKKKLKQTKKNNYKIKDKIKIEFNDKFLNKNLFFYGSIIKIKKKKLYTILVLKNNKRYYQFFLESPLIKYIYKLN